VKCATYVAAGLADRGIVFCGTGIGISIAANKIKGIRCALVTSRVEAEFAAAHNHANMLAFGGRTTTAEDAAVYTQVWLTTPEDFAERHVRRVEMLNAL
jgi:ribose 5-phosphate isomerase B